jgi:hypothetical protein
MTRFVRSLMACLIGLFTSSAILAQAPNPEALNSLSQFDLIKIMITLSIITLSIFNGKSNTPTNNNININHYYKIIRPYFYY